MHNLNFPQDVFAAIGFKTWLAFAKLPTISFEWVSLFPTVLPQRFVSRLFVNVSHLMDGEHLTVVLITISFVMSKLEYLFIY